MARHLLAATDHLHMPWKNGAGETIEIAREPRGASLSDFAWRISMATVAADGPFSCFPGIDRTLAVLDGDGIVLEIEGMEPRRLDGDSEPLAFAADRPTTARLLSGPILDLNLMTRRQTHDHAMERIALPAATSGEDGAEVFLVFPSSCAVTHSGTHIAISSLDALRLEGQADKVLIEGRGHVYRLVIRPRPPAQAAR